MNSISGYLRLLSIAAMIGLSGIIANGQTADEGPEASAPASFEDLHETWLATDNLQLERPIPEDSPEIDPPNRQSIGFLRWLADLLNSLGPVFRFIFYAGLAFVVGTILYFILTQFTDIRFTSLRKRPQAPKDDVLVAARPDQAVARSLLEEADALARNGQFNEAVHLLLFRSIQDIRSRRDGRLPDALTAREIGELQDLPERPRSALKPIVTLVERSFFGGRDLLQDDWKTARASYEEFAFGEAWT